MGDSKSKYQEDLTDSEIWNLFCSGSKSAFEFIYQEYFDKLYSYGRQFTSDTSLVEDTIQELFIELNRRKEHLSKTDRILPYLYGAFRRKIIRYRTKLSRFKEMDLANSFLFEYSVESSLIEKEEKESLKAKLHHAINGLSEKDREIIYLFYYENFSYEEIQDIQGFENIKSARNLLYKAVKALKRSLLTIVLWGVFVGFLKG